MIQRIVTRHRRDQAGFTLIELLVVIIILGILAAVVVFAVNGVGDKGESSASTIDERTVRTAQETFCAREGRYGTTQELMDAQLLSNKPTYTGVYVDTPGPCGSTAYQIFSTDMPALSGLNATVCQSGAFCLAPLADGTSPTANNRFPLGAPWPQLANGKVLVPKLVTSTTGGSGTPVAPFQLFDPAGGPLGTWSPVAPPASTGPTTPPGAVPNTFSSGTPGISMALIKGGPDQCGSNCGKVLAKFAVNSNYPSDTTTVNQVPWRLYDPNTPVPGTSSAGSWEDLDTRHLPDGPYRRWGNVDLVQLNRPPCGTNCGKILIVGGQTQASTIGAVVAEAEIWDPLTGAFRKLGFTNGYASGAGYSATALNDGKVLVVASKTGGGSLTQLFDPVTETFTDVASAPYAHRRQDDRTALLPDGTVLATAEANSADRTHVMIYDPRTNTWDGTVPYCGATGFLRCSILTTLPDGKVLAKRAALPSQSTEPLQIFDPVTKTWASTPISASTNQAVILRETQPGSCGALCNRVLTIGNAASAATGGVVQIYTP